MSGLILKDKIAEIQKLIEKNKSISIISHFNPDGDAIGAVLAMYHYLKTLPGKTLNMYVPDDFPDYLKWMPESEKIYICDKNNVKALEEIKKSDLIFFLDFNHTSRIPCLRETVLNLNADKILIDHHPKPEQFANIIISETKVSSTSELLFTIIKELGGKITIPIAECLFTGIMTDTGGFSHNSSNYGTYEIVANLLKTGINKNHIFDNIYHNYSADRMKLMGYCLHSKMKVFPEYQTAYISLTKKELEEFNFKTGDTEGFVNMPLSIKGIKASALFIEKDNMIKTSFRSKGDLAINEIARKYFNGGGHKNAAGGEYYGTMEETVKRFIEIMPEIHKK